MNYSDTLAMLEQAKLKPIAAKEHLDELCLKLRRDENFIIDDEAADAIEAARIEYDSAGEEYEDLTKSIPEIGMKLHYSRSVADAMKKSTEESRHMMVFHRHHYLTWLTEEISHSYENQAFQQSKQSYRQCRDQYLLRFRWMHGREPTHAEMTAPTPYD